MATLSVNVTSPQLIFGRKSKEPMFRFTLTWGILEDQDNEAIIETHRGCFARWEADTRSITWSHPLTFTGFQRECLSEGSPKFYRLVKESLERAGVHTALRDKWDIWKMAETALNPLHEREGQTTEKI